MSDQNITGTIVTSDRGGDDKVGVVVESDSLERAKKNEKREFGSEGQYRNMVAVQWYEGAGERLNDVLDEFGTDGVIQFIENYYDNAGIGWHKMGALLVLKEADNE